MTQYNLSVNLTVFTLLILADVAAIFGLCWVSILSFPLGSDKLERTWGIITFCCFVYLTSSITGYIIFFLLSIVIDKKSTIYDYNSLVFSLILPTLLLIKILHKSLIQREESDQVVFNYSKKKRK